MSDRRRFATSTSSCARAHQPATASPATAVPLAGHVLELSNARVRVHRVVVAPGRRLEPHTHAGAVLEVLVGGDAVAHGAGLAVPVAVGAFEWHGEGALDGVRNPGRVPYRGRRGRVGPLTVAEMTESPDRCRAFHRLHEAGCFVMPNPWDLGSARVLAQLGFPALATTSAGFAWSMGRADNGVTLAEALSHLRAIAGSVDIPVNADFEGGFAIAPEAVGVNVAAAANTGVAGLSIEDSTGDPSKPLSTSRCPWNEFAPRGRRSTRARAPSFSPPVPKGSSSGGRTSTKPSVG